MTVGITQNAGESAEGPRAALLQRTGPTGVGRVLPRNVCSNESKSANPIGVLLILTNLVLPHQSDALLDEPFGNTTVGGLLSATVRSSADGMIDKGHFLSCLRRQHVTTQDSI
jgi:hypothetical protein